MKILKKYTLKIFFSTLGVGLFLFTFIMLMERLFHLADAVIAKGVGVGEVLILLLYSIPLLLVLAMPMAAAAASVITFGTMASEREVTAIRTSGSTLSPIIKPVLTSVFIITMLMIPFNYYIAPLTNFAFRQRFTELAYKEPAFQIEEGKQIEIEGYTLIAHSVDHRNKTLHEVWINKPAENDDPEITINARRAEWNTDENNTLSIILYDGVIRHQPSGKPKILSSVKFEEYSIILRKGTEEVEVSKNLQSMSPSEMTEEINRLEQKGLPAENIAAQFHLRGALAGAIIGLVLCGIPLGLRAEVKGKAIGAGISIGIIAVYYFLMVGGLKLAFSGGIKPWVGVWLPNFIISAAGIIMLSKSYSR